VTIINQTTNITNITYNNSTVVDQGPIYDELRSRSQYSIERLRLQRNSDANFDDDRAVVKREVLAAPAPISQPTTTVIRPPSINQTIAKTIVERGWSEITDQQAAKSAGEGEWNNSSVLFRTLAKHHPSGSSITRPLDSPPPSIMTPSEKETATAPTPGAEKRGKKTQRPATTSPNPTPSLIDLSF